FRVALAPFEQGLENGTELLALVGQQVLGARRMLLVEAPLDDPRVLQSLQPRRQRVRAQADKRLLELMKFTRPEADELPNNENGPSFADHIERPGDWAEVGRSQL